MHADGFHLTVQSRGRRFVSGITIKLEDSFQLYVVVGSSLSGRAFGRTVVVLVLFVKENLFSYTVTVSLASKKRKTRQRAQSVVVLLFTVVCS